MTTDDDTSQAYVAEYDFTGNAPRLGKTVRLWPDNDFDGEHADIEFTTVEAAERFTAFLDAQHTVRWEYRATRYDALEPVFKDALRSLYDDLGLGYYSNKTRPRIETPTSDGISVHKAKRRTLEAFLREWDIEYTVSCMTLHSDRACQLTLED